MTSAPATSVLTLRRFGQHFPEDDVFGLSPAERAQWGDRCCGLACVRTALEHFGLPVPAQVEMLPRALEIGAYSDRGWIHIGLLELARQYGLDGATGKVESVYDLAALAAAEVPTIVSSTLHFPTDGRRGGHLVAFAGMSGEAGQELAHFADPSRWGELNATVPASRFWASCTGNVIALWDTSTPDPAALSVMRVGRS
jgi:hypothetical protein